TFSKKLRELEIARTELADLPNERRRGLARLDAEREAHQRTRYLDGFEIARAKIRHIGASRTAMLESYGIETAADVAYRAILKIPGFGPKYTSSLVAWRKGHERRFRFDPNEPIDPQELASLDQRLAARSQELLSLLRQGPVSLRIVGQEVASARQRLGPL